MCLIPEILLPVEPLVFVRRQILLQLVAGFLYLLAEMLHLADQRVFKAAVFAVRPLHVFSLKMAFDGVFAAALLSGNAGKAL